MSKKRRDYLCTRFWWALARSPKALPCLFATRQDAVENRDSDERIFRVAVVPLERHARSARGRRSVGAERSRSRP